MVHIYDTHVLRIPVLRDAMAFVDDRVL